MCTDGGGFIMQRIEQLERDIATGRRSPILVKKTPVGPRAKAGEAALQSGHVPRTVARTADHRTKFRHSNMAATALVFWKRGCAEAKLLNASEQGLMIEAAIAPAIGAIVEIHVEGCDPIQARVVWRKGSRLGLVLGGPANDLIPQG
jgi:hypothetical protein